MNVVGKVGSLISQGVYSVATPFHPFGGSVDIIVVEQPDGTYRSTPWYVRFGKFQGVLKGAEKIVGISVNGVEAGFHMYLDNSGQAYFIREVLSSKSDGTGQDLKSSNIMEVTQEDNSISECNNQNENDVLIANEIKFSEGCVPPETDQIVNSRLEIEEHLYDEDERSQGSPVGSPVYAGYRYESIDHGEDIVKSQVLDSEVVLVSVDGHVLTAPISLCEQKTDNVQLSTPQFHLDAVEVSEVMLEQLQDSATFVGSNGNISATEEAWAASILAKIDSLLAKRVSEGVVPVCGDDNICSSNHLSETCENVGTIANPVQKSAEYNRMGDDSMGCSDSDAKDASLNRKEIFKSCLGLSEMTLDIEIYEKQKSCCSSMGLTASVGTHNLLGESSCSQSSVEKTGIRKDPRVENGFILSLPDSYSLCNTGLQTLCRQHQDSENKACSNKTMEYVGSDSVSVHYMSTDSQEGGHLAATIKPQKAESSQRMPATDDKCEKDDILESQTEIAGGRTDVGLGFEISLCRNELHAGMGLQSADEAFNEHCISKEEFQVSGASLIKNENLIVRFKERYFTWDKAAPIILGMAAFGLDFPAEAKDAIPVEQEEKQEVREDSPVLCSTPSDRRWRLWPIPFRRVKNLRHTTSNISSEDVFVDSESFFETSSEPASTGDSDNGSPYHQFVRTNIPTTEQIASLNLKDGQNMITFSFSTRVLGKQQVDAHIYLWKWNTRVVISDVDGTITKSDVLGQFMPLVGKDWTQSGVAHLFSAIKENGYQLLFLSARAIVQAYLTRSFLLNLKQDGKALPSGPVVISPDGLFPSLYREVIRRAPHEFKIACLEDIRALFPADYNPFYAGFGNRDTDKISYRKIGIPGGKIFIINPKGEVAINHCIDVKSYTSLHTLVNDMFPPTSLAEQEDFNSWNYWKMPLPDIDY